jgi:hypothetical protein
MMELAIKTKTADSRMASHRVVRKSISSLFPANGNGRIGCEATLFPAEGQGSGGQHR